MNIEDVMKKHEDALLRYPNVIGVGIGEKQRKPIIKVLVTCKLSPAALKPQDLLPKQLDGYDVDVEAIGLPTVN